MPAAPLPPDEELRLRTLQAERLLDTAPEQEFDDLCRLAAGVCDTASALVTLVDRRRQWFKARHNFDVQETERDCSFCAHAIVKGEILVADDTAQHESFADNRLVLSSPNVRFYAGVPVHSANGQPLGSLCVIDYQPRTLSSHQHEGLRALARQVEKLLEHRRVRRDNDSLGRFVVHDMRNTLTGLMMAVGSVAQGMKSGAIAASDVADAERAARILKHRIDDFHFLLSSQSGTLPMRFEHIDVHALARDVVSFSPKERLILETRITVDDAYGDVDLLRRVLENLLANAYRVAPEGSTVELGVWQDADAVHFQVTDQGPGVPPELQDRIFELGQSIPARGGRASTGLGLTFCQMAARAMGGRIRYLPASAGGSCFRLSLPRTFD